jgi:HPt (histidine-containing phosphotransfer) domain-containing protein
MAYTNLDYLRMITEGDTESVVELIGLFLDQVPEFIENMNKFLAEGRYEELGKEAHKAKSSVMIMGMDDLGHDMKSLQLDTIAKTGVETYGERVSKFEMQCLAAVEELNIELEKMK